MASNVPPFMQVKKYQQIIMNYIASNLMWSRLMLSAILCDQLNLVLLSYSYQPVIVISLTLKQSDHFNVLPIYCLFWFQPNSNQHHFYISYGWSSETMVGQRNSHVMGMSKWSMKWNVKVHSKQNSLWKLKRKCF